MAKLEIATVQPLPTPRTPPTLLQLCGLGAGREKKPEEEVDLEKEEIDRQENEGTSGQETPSYGEVGLSKG